MRGFVMIVLNVERVTQNQVIEIVMFVLCIEVSRFIADIVPWSLEEGLIETDMKSKGTPLRLRSCHSIDSTSYSAKKPPSSHSAQILIEGYL